MRVLVTGGAGFIGSNLCVALAERHDDWEVVALDNLYRKGSELNLPRLKDAGVEFVEADVREPLQLEKAGDFDVLVECSAEPSVLAARELIVPVNVFGAYNCFELAASRGAQVIFLSTSRVYPIAALEGLVFDESEQRYDIADGQRVPGASPLGIAEDFPLEGRRTMYGASKLAGELLLAEYDVDWVINRCGVVAGPWQMGKVDQGVFTHWAISAYFERPLSYIGYGATGKQVRDLIDVADLVDLLERQITERDHFSGHTFNVGGGPSGSLSLLQTTEICEEITGRNLDVGAVAETRPGDVRCYISDSSKLYSHTDWRPRRTPSNTLADTLQWIADNEELVRSTL